MLGYVLLLLCMNLGGKKMIYLGYTTMTHGVKGELKFYSDFSLKDQILKKGQIVYINGEKHEISAVRPFKHFYLLELDNLKDINLVEDFRNKKVYFQKEESALSSKDIIPEEMVGFSILENGKVLGKVEEIMYNKVGILLRVKRVKTFYIPCQKEFIKEISLEDKTIYTQNGEDLII